MGNTPSRCTFNGRGSGNDGKISNNAKGKCGETHYVNAHNTNNTKSDNGDHTISFVANAFHACDHHPNVNHHKGTCKGIQKGTNSTSLYDEEDSDIL